MSDIKKCEFTCDICRDLIPLVKDGVASPDSENAVKIHLKKCKKCSAVLEDKPIPEIPEKSPNKALMRLKKWLTLVYSVILLFGLYFALSFSGSRIAGVCMLIMPFAGIFAYLAFRKKALFILPAVIIPLHWLLNETGNLRIDWRIGSGEFWRLTLVYYLLAVTGIVIMSLLKFAFGKINFEKKGNDDEN